MSADEIEALVQTTVATGDGSDRGLVLRCEQGPNPESRVTLGAQVDRLGLPLVHLHWALSPEDVLSIRKGLALVGVHLGKLGLGRIHGRFDDLGALENPVAGGPHHMGTARMHADQTLGVVDAECRAHTVENLYVAGSAVFPSSGWSNPTLTIVALALRLANHIRRVLG